MVKERYPFDVFGERTVFTLIGVGRLGEFEKVVWFQPTEENGRWNLAFGDRNDVDFDDRMIAIINIEWLTKHGEI